MLDASARAALSSTRFDDVRWLEEVGSTNDVVAELARSGGADGVVVAADRQTAGRGRRGRSWEAAPGTSVLISVLLRLQWPPAMAQVSTLAMALAAASACETAAGVSVGLKWPNDVVAVDGRKVGGVLAERIDGAVVVGLGLNVVGPAPVDGAVALDELAEGREVSRSEVLVHVLRHLDALLAQPPTFLVDAVRGRSATLGRRIRVDLGDRVVEGRAHDLSPEGHLVVETADGLLTVSAADVVHLRPEPRG